MGKDMDTRKPEVSRRDFLKTSAVASLATVGSGARHAFAAGSDTMRVGIVGCGSRGTRAAYECVSSSDGVEIVALADLFEDQLNKCLAMLSKRMDDKISVTEETCFLGFDAYKKLLACDIDVVLLTTPPHFRPEHLKAAVEAGKHVFMEKPAAVDPVGVRSIIAAGEIAKKKGLSIVAGTQQRRQPQYIEILKRIHNGEIGDVVGGQCFWNWGSMHWHFAPRKGEWSDMEWQCRIWPYFTWLSGDHIVEQHLHNIDIINWAIGSHPIECVAVGGRQVRTGPQYGNIFDHFSVDYVYPNGVRVMSMCSQIEGTAKVICERVVGAKGRTYTTRGEGYIAGENPYTFDGEPASGFVEEHADLIKSVRGNAPINEARQVAESTLSVIMGRMSAYTGQKVTWDWVLNKSKLDLRPEKYELGDLPVRPLPVPGKTPLV